MNLSNDGLVASHYRFYGTFFYNKIYSIIFIGDLPTTNIIEPFYVYDKVERKSNDIKVINLSLNEEETCNKRNRNALLKLVFSIKKAFLTNFMI